MSKKNNKSNASTKPEKDNEEVIATEVINEDPADLTPTKKPTSAEEAEQQVTSAENVDNIEQELKEEYKEETEKAEEVLEETEKEVEADLGVAAEAAEKYGDAEKRLNDIVEENKPEELAEALQKEMEDAKKMEEKLEENIEKIEKSLSDKHRELNSRMTNIWNGVRYT